MAEDNKISNFIEEWEIQKRKYIKRCTDLRRKKGTQVQINLNELKYLKFLFLASRKYK